jgi:hypothetical protein
MTDREKRIVTHSLSLAHGLLMAHDCPEPWRAVLLQYQCTLVMAWGQNSESLTGDEQAELIAAVTDALSSVGIASIANHQSDQSELSTTKRPK